MQYLAGHWRLNEISSLQNNRGLCSSDLKVADEEEEGRRRLQLADGGLDVETGSKEKVENSGEEQWAR